MKNGPYVKYALIAVVVIVVLAVLGFAWVHYRSGGNSGSALHFAKIDANSVPKGARLGPISYGEIPSFFPRGLLIGAGPLLTQINGLPIQIATRTAETIPSAQYALSWNTSSSMSEIYGEYKKLIASRNWTVVADNATSTQFREITVRLSAASSLVPESDDDETHVAIATSRVIPMMIIVIVPKGSGSVVTVDYLYQSENHPRQ